MNDFMMGKPQEVIELGDDFDLEGYEVARREFFGHTKEPSVTFANYKIHVNAACLNRLPSIEYIQPMVNSRRKTLVLRASREEEHDAIPWCVPGSLQRKPRRVSCKIFFTILYTLMSWNPDYRYKLLGKAVHAKNGYFIVFDLTAVQVFQSAASDGEEAKTFRNPIFPADWQGSFGLPYEKHRQAIQVNIIDGYTVYAIRNTGIVQIAEFTKEQISDIPENTTNDFCEGVDDE